MKIGIIREGKIPPDFRVPLTPKQCKQAMLDYPVRIVVESSPTRCYKDEEYRQAGIEVTADIADCDILMGVKEVPTGQLIPGKTYLFFSHTIKKQAYNRKLLWAILDKKIKLIDYEALTDGRENRLIAFGRFAGMVGAHNALWTYGMRTGGLSMPRMKEFHDYKAATGFYKTLRLPPVKVVLTGTGRVATGAADVLRDMGLKQVKQEDFLQKKYDEAVFTQLASQHYVTRKHGQPFNKAYFYEHPDKFKSVFAPYSRVADIMINGIYWDNNAPAFFTREEMTSPDFKIQVIADVTCDIAPKASIPATLRASTIADPVFGFDPKTGTETKPFQPNCVDMMTIDNLPNEMPRDASESFGNQFLANILPALCKPKSDMIDHATITRDGHLTRHFRYLADYAKVPATNELIA